MRRESVGWMVWEEHFLFLQKAGEDRQAAAIVLNIGADHGSARDRAFQQWVVRFCARRSISIFFNALKECITQQPEFGGWKEVLNALLGILGKTEYRKRYVARCCEGISAWQIALVNNITSTFLDWKWEFVEELLYWVLLAMPWLIVAPHSLASLTHSEFIKPRTTDF